MSSPTSSHAYGIGLIAVLVGLSASVVFYTSFYLPESLAKPSVSHAILEPAEEFFLIEIVPGAVIEGNENYVPNKPTVSTSVVTTRAYFSPSRMMLPFLELV